MKVKMPKITVGLELPFEKVHHINTLDRMLTRPIVVDAPFQSLNSV